MEPLKAHLAEVQKRHSVAMQQGYGGVELPRALERKYPPGNLHLLPNAIPLRASMFRTDAGNGSSRKVHSEDNNGTSDPHDGELRGVGKGFQLLGEIANPQGNMVGGALLAPVVEELVQGSI